MKNEEIEKLVKLRRHVIEFYDGLEEKHSSTSVMNTKHTSVLCEQVIKSIDSLLKDYVKFQ